MFSFLVKDNFMLKYNFDFWLNSQLGLSLQEMIENGFDIISDAELIAVGFRPEEEDFSKEECGKFAIRIKTFMTLLKFGLKDVRVSEPDWQSFKPFCDALVDNKQMDKAILDKF